MERIVRNLTSNLKMQKILKLALFFAFLDTKEQSKFRTLSASSLKS